MSRSLSNLAKKRAMNLSHGLKVVIHQLHHASPEGASHSQRENSNGFSPSGLIDRIYSRLTCIDDDKLRVSSVVQMPDGAMGENNDYNDHKPLLSFLEETLDRLEAKSSHSIVEFMRFYNSFRDRLLSMR